MSDPVFDELAALVRLGDADWWARRDRELAAREAEQNATAERDRMRRRALLLRENGFTDVSLHGALLAKPVETVALKHARLFEQLSHKALVLAGATGVGKSTAATWCALKREDSAPGFVRAGELERRGRYDRTMETWLSARTSLVIDDLGAEVLDSKGVFRSLLDELLDRFYASRLVLIITTNLHAPQLVDRYGDRVQSRLKQRGVWADCGTRDLRMEVP